jgi:hypothetical protein
MLISLFCALLLHPSHKTISEVDWNAETRRVEVAIRLDALDEQWLRQRLAGQSKTFQWAVAYLQSKYRIAETPKPDQKDSCVYHWIGREEDGSHVWWYFEIEPRNGQPPDWIDVRVLFEREKNYTHQIVRLGLTPRHSITLSIQRPRGPFDPSDEPSSDRSEFPAAIPATGNSPAAD